MAHPEEILDRAETVSGALAERVERAPDSECLILIDRERREHPTSLREFWSRARDVHATMAARGVRPGESVLLILPTGSELVCAYFGAMLAGAIPALAATPTNRVADQTRYRAMIAGIVRNADARVVYCESDVAALLCDGGDEAAVLGNAQTLQPDEVGHASDPPEPFAAAPDDIATLQYSSGTTGTPKGILLPHRSMLLHLRSLRDGLEITPGDVHVNWAPLYHDMGLLGCFLLPLLCGGKTVLIPTLDFLRDPASWLWAIDKHRGSVSWAPNFAYSFCAKRIGDEQIEGLDLSSWRLALCASEPVLAHTVAAFADRFAAYGYSPEAMTPAWGLAETTMVGTAHPPGMAPIVETIDRARLANEGRAVPVVGDGVASVATGRCLPGYEMEVRDRDGRPLADREVGEVWLRTEARFAGYRKDPELTAEVLVDGWVCSGDQGYLDGEDLFFVARNKDLIVMGGEKYAPHDIETTVNQVPGVREGCAVAFGVLNEERGTEELGVVAETREPDEAHPALARSIRAAVREGLGLAVRHLKLVPPGGIEKTTSGKLARRATFERYRVTIDS
jgi:acyl-CoA synthetase (AMP-forming)/AMP-acid ligase II